MNAATKIEAPRNVYQKLNDARLRFHATELRKSGKNTFAGYSYFELGDFLVPALKIFNEVGLSAVISFCDHEATMAIVNVDDTGERIYINSPMGSAALKGCHEVQNIGAVETYQRRYLWVTALEIVEHDALDATGGRDKAESEVSPPPEPVITEEQYIKLMALIPAARLTPAQFNQTMCCPRVCDLPASKYDEAVNRLENRMKELAKADTNAKAKENA